MISATLPESFGIIPLPISQCLAGLTSAARLAGRERLGLIVPYRPEFVRRLDEGTLVGIGTEHHVVSWPYSMFSVMLPSMIVSR